MPDTPNFLGANIDTRPPVAQQKDFHIKELVASAAPVPWVEKPESQWRKFPDQNQDGSGSCVAQTKKKLNGIKLFEKTGRYTEFSATPTYQKRSNRPAGGMIGIEAFDIEKTYGATLESLVPSTQMSDAQMDAQPIPPFADAVAAIFKDSAHVGFTSGDMETVASTIHTTKKGVMVWFYFTAQEWSQLVPSIIDPNLRVDDSATLRHSVAAVDFTLWNGQKALIIEDSAPFGGFHRRIITEDFFKKRNWFSRYSLQFKFEEASLPVMLKPVYTFSKPLVFIPLNAIGNVSDPVLHESQKQDVIALQTILRYEGFFPNNTGELTGYYGSITARAVLSWQKAHNVAPLAELDLLQGRRIGARSIAELNRIYSS